MQPGATTLNHASPTLNRVSSSSASPSSSSAKLSSSSFSRPPLPVSNRFGVLSEECLFPLSLSPMSKSARRRSRRKHRLSVALRISSAALSSSVAVPSTVSSFSVSSASVLAPISLASTHDLGSDDPITLPCTVNENHHATCMIDSGASSQFIDLDFALGLNLALDIAPCITTPDLVEEFFNRIREPEEEDDEEEEMEAEDED